MPNLECDIAESRDVQAGVRPSSADSWGAPLVDLLPDPIWILDFNGSVTWSNRAGLGYLLAGETVWLNLVHSEDRQEVEDAWTTSVDTKSPLRTDCRLRGSKGEHRWFRIQGRLLLRPEEGGGAVAPQWLMAAHDIDAEVARELALRSRLRTQLAMLDTSIDCIKVISPDGCLVDMNKSGCLALGVPQSSEFGMDWLSLLPGDVRAGGRNALEEARAGKLGRFPGRSELPGHAPRHWDNVLTPVLDASGHTETILCLSRDVSEQRELEDRLRLSNSDLEAKVSLRTAELARLWNTSLDLLLVISSNGEVVRGNPAWRQVLGYEPGEMIGRHVGDFIVPEDRVAGEELMRRGSAGMQQPVEIRHLHSDGSPRWVEWIAVPFGSEIYATGRHVSAAKQAAAKLQMTQEALYHAQKVEAIGRLTGNVAHDFNSLLSVMRTTLAFLCEPGQTEGRRARCIDILTSTTEQAITVTRQLLDFTRRSPLASSAFSVAARARGLKEMLSMLCGGGIRIDMHIDDGSYPVLADPNQFDTMLVNLASNARDAMQGAGTLTIAVRPTPYARDSWRRSVRTGDYVAVSVADSGPGVPEDIADRIFEPFFTTKTAGLGTGLGLSQVVGFADQADGTVGLDDSGPGASFTVYLPVAPAST